MLQLHVLAISLALCLCHTAASSNRTADIIDINIAAANPEAYFNGTWRVQYVKTYQPGSQEYATRLAIFQANLAYIQSFNAVPTNTFWLAIGPNMDLTTAEVLQSKTGFVPNLPRAAPLSSLTRRRALLQTPPTTPPLLTDWSVYGKTTSVMDQGLCNGSWSLASVAAMETLHAIMDNTLVQLSQQQLISCLPSLGCTGGNPTDAFSSVAVAGISKLFDYPYVSANGSVPSCDGAKAGYRAYGNITGYEIVTPGNQEAMVEAVASQAVTVGISIGPSFIHYGGGVYNDFQGCGSNSSHAVVITGYSIAGQYWIVRNSWGAGWGVGGYALMTMGAVPATTPGYPAEKLANGVCNILAQASYPVVDRTKAPPRSAGSGKPSTVVQVGGGGNAAGHSAPMPLWVLIPALLLSVLALYQ